MLLLISFKSSCCLCFLLIDLLLSLYLGILLVEVRDNFGCEFRPELGEKVPGRKFLGLQVTFQRAQCDHPYIVVVHNDESHTKHLDFDNALKGLILGFFGLAVFSPVLIGVVSSNVGQEFRFKSARETCSFDHI